MGYVVFYKQSLFGEHEDIAWVDYTRGESEVCILEIYANVNIYFNTRVK